MKRFALIAFGLFALVFGAVTPRAEPARPRVVQLELRRLALDAVEPLQPPEPVAVAALTVEAEAPIAPELRARRLFLLHRALLN